MISQTPLAPPACAMVRCRLATPCTPQWTRPRPRHPPLLDRSSPSARRSHAPHCSVAAARKSGDTLKKIQQRMFSSENKILKIKTCAQVYAKHLSVRAAALSLVEHPASEQQIHKYVGKHWALHCYMGWSVHTIKLSGSFIYIMIYTFQKPCFHEEETHGDAFSLPVTLSIFCRKQWKTLSHDWKNSNINNNNNLWRKNNTLSVNSWQNCWAKLDQILKAMFHYFPACKSRIMRMIKI